MKILNKVSAKFKKVKNLIKFYTETKHSYTPPSGKPYAIINLDSFLLNTDRGRFTFILNQILNFDGYEIALRLDRRFFLNNATYQRMLLEQGYTWLKKSNTTLNTIELHNSNAAPKKIELRYGYSYNSNPIQAWYFPFPLHPFNYKARIQKETFDAYQKTERKIKIFLQAVRIARYITGIL